MEEVAARIRAKIESINYEEKCKFWVDKLSKILQEEKSKQYTIEYEKIDTELLDLINKTAKEQKDPWHFYNPDPETMPINKFFQLINLVNKDGPICTVDWGIEMIGGKCEKHTALFINLAPSKKRFDKENKYNMEFIELTLKLQREKENIPDSHHFGNFDDEPRFR